MSRVSQARSLGKYFLLVDNMLVVLGFFVVFPLISIRFVDQMGWAALMVGIALGLRQFVQQGLGVFGGAIADRFGAKPMIVTGMLLRAAGFATMAVAQEPWLLWFSCFLSGIGGTLFDPPAERLDIAPRKLWIALGDKAHGSVTVDDGAAKALVSRGSSLLAVGIREVDGQFAEGDVLDVCDPSGMVVARGIAEADSDVLELAAGRRQDQIASNRLLANLAEKPAIHRDNLIVFA